MCDSGGAGFRVGLLAGGLIFGGLYGVGGILIALRDLLVMSRRAGG